MNALNLALRNRWLRQADYARSYDTLAELYDQQWAVHLRATTDRLLGRLPDELSRAEILDLGCGTGYSTAILAERYPECSVTGIDISAEMLRVAGGRSPSSIQWRQDDMLDFLRTRPTASASLIFSAWAIGYSHPPRIIAEAARVLQPNGVLAFIVNRIDTMPAVFDAFQKTMRRFPDALARSLWPRFPKSGATLRQRLISLRFTVRHFEEGAVGICPPQGPRIDWILTTGVLAGFDHVLPLTEPGPVRDFFAHQLEPSSLPWEHRFVMAVAER